MKLYAGDIAVKNIMLHTDTDDATLKASDLQQGVTAYARGQKVTGTGKTFTFASYGDFESNLEIPLPSTEINTLVVGAVGYPIRMTKTALELQATNFETTQEVATITIDGTDYQITIKVANSRLTISCGKTVTLQLMYGKDEYT